MKKRLLALLTALSMIAALAACGGRPKEQAGEPEQVEDTAVEEAAEDGTAVLEPEEEAGGAEAENLPSDPAEKAEDGNLPADTTQKPEGKPAEKPAQKPAAPVEKPAEKPAEKPSGEQGAPAAKVDLADFYNTVSSGGNWPAMMQVEGETLDAFYSGLSGIKTSQCGVYTAMISAAVGEIALVEVENSADVQAVKDIFQARIDYQVGDDQNPGGAWYPATIEGWKNGSRIVSNGNYVMLVALSEGADDVVNSFNALFA